MSFINRDGQLRTTVSTYANLPLVSNVLGDIRIASDTGYAYTWLLVSPTGSLSDWKKLTISNYNDLVGAPSLPIYEIDSAVHMAVTTFLNNIMLGALVTSGTNGSILKFFEGILDRQGTEDGTASLTNLFRNAWLLNSPTLGMAQFLYPTRGNAPLDKATRTLIDCRSLVSRRGDVGFEDTLNHGYQPFGNVTLDGSIKKFGSYSLNFDGTNSYFVAEGDYSRFFANGKNFAYDMWIYPKATGLQGIIEDRGILIQQSASNKITSTITTAVYSGETRTSTATLTATSTSSLTLNTWTHVVVQRRNGYLEIYINGVLEATSVSQNNGDLNVGETRPTLVRDWNTHYLYLGKDWAGNFFNGNIDEYRLSFDVTRYNSNFTPNTFAYNTHPTEVVSTFQSTLFSSDLVPTSARVVLLFLENYMDLQANIDVQMFASRDGGATWTAVVLGRHNDIVLVGVDYFTGVVDLSSQPIGKLLCYKIIINNNKDLFIGASGIFWK